MAEPDVLPDDIENVDLTQTDIAPKDDKNPAPAADEGKDDAAAAPDKPADEPAKPDADDASAKDKPADKPAEGDKPEDGKPAAGDQKPEEPAKTPEQLREEQQARARMEYQNRQRARTQVEERIDQNFAPKTEEDLIEEGVAPEDAKIQALREEMAFNNRRAEIAELNAGMGAAAVAVEADFDVFNPKSPNYDKEYTEEVDSLYRTASRLQTQEVTDVTGNKSQIIVNAEVPLYDFYQKMAGLYSRGASKGAKQGQEQMQEMIAATENPGGSSSTGATAGSLEEMEERLGDTVIT